MSEATVVLDGGPSRSESSSPCMAKLDRLDVGHVRLVRYRRAIASAFGPRRPRSASGSATRSARYLGGLATLGSGRRSALRADRRGRPRSETDRVTPGSSTSSTTAPGTSCGRSMCGRSLGASSDEIESHDVPDPRRRRVRRGSRRSAGAARRSSSRRCMVHDDQLRPVAASGARSISRCRDRCRSPSILRLRPICSPRARTSAIPDDALERRRSVRSGRRARGCPRHRRSGATRSTASCCWRCSPGSGSSSSPKGPVLFNLARSIRNLGMVGSRGVATLGRSSTTRKRSKRAGTAPRSSSMCLAPPSNGGRYVPDRTEGTPGEP